MRNNDKDVNKPIKVYGQGVCPKCNQATLVLNLYSAEHIFLDEFGQPIYEQNVCKETVVCPNCNFVGKIGEDFMRLEDGSVKWVSEAERIYEENRMKELRPATHLHADNNPFIESEE